HPRRYSKTYCYSVLESMIDSDSQMRQLVRNKSFRFPDCHYSPKVKPMNGVASQKKGDITRNQVCDTTTSVRINECSRQLFADIVRRRFSSLATGIISKQPN